MSSMHICEPALFPLLKTAGTAGSKENKREKFEQNIFLVLETVGHQSMTFIVSCYMGIYPT